MPYDHLIAANVMTLGVCQSRSSIARFSILTSASRGPSAIAEPLVLQRDNISSLPKGMTNDPSKVRGFAHVTHFCLRNYGLRKNFATTRC